jgi:hypothetical protein
MSRRKQGAEKFEVEMECVLREPFVTSTSGSGFKVPRKLGIKLSSYYAKIETAVPCNIPVLRTTTRGI